VLILFERYPGTKCGSAVLQHIRIEFSLQSNQFRRRHAIRRFCPTGLSIMERQRVPGFHEKFFIAGPV